MNHFITGSQGGKITENICVERRKGCASPKSVGDVLQSLGGYLEVFAKTALFAFPATFCWRFFGLSLR